MKKNNLAYVILAISILLTGYIKAMEQPAKVDMTENPAIKVVLGTLRNETDLGLELKMDNTVIARIPARKSIKVYRNIPLHFQALQKEMNQPDIYKPAQKITVFNKNGFLAELDIKIRTYHKAVNFNAELLAPQRLIGNFSEWLNMYEFEKELVAAKEIRFILDIEFKDLIKNDKEYNLEDSDIDILTNIN